MAMTPKPADPGCMAMLGALCLAGALVSCSDGDIPGYDALVRQVEGKRVGHGADYWIEMENLQGQWERTGLIFGYADDNEECEKAIAGLKRVNYAREYRCMPAN